MSDWIEWKGGEQPVKDWTLIDVRYRDSTECFGVIAGSGEIQFTNKNDHCPYFCSYWGHDNPNDGSEIIAYRLHKK